MEAPFQQSYYDSVTACLNFFREGQSTGERHLKVNTLTITFYDGLI